MLNRDCLADLIVTTDEDGTIQPMPVECICSPIAETDYEQAKIYYVEFIRSIILELKDKDGYLGAAEPSVDLMVVPNKAPKYKKYNIPYYSCVCAVCAVIPGVGRFKKFPFMAVNSDEHIYADVAVVQSLYRATEVLKEKVRSGAPLFFDEYIEMQARELRGEEGG